MGYLLGQVSPDEIIVAGVSLARGDTRRDGRPRSLCAAVCSRSAGVERGQPADSGSQTRVAVLARYRDGSYLATLGSPRMRMIEAGQPIWMLGSMNSLV